MVTIAAFRTALLSPAKYFNTLADTVWGEQTIRRSTLFAEAVMLKGTECKLVCLPLSSISLRRAETFALLKRFVDSPIVPHYAILRDEMNYVDSLERITSADIYAEPMPTGITLEEALDMLGSRDEAEQLLAALDALQATLLKADISLNNLRIENIIVDDDGVLHPIRWYYATVGAGKDKEAFETLRTKIAVTVDESMELHDKEAAAYSAYEDVFGQHIEVRPMFEGLAAAEDDSGWGFIDSLNRQVIAPEYLWVNDFHEGRAEVETELGMGLIDKTGRYIIPPQYSIVDYDPLSGRSQVCMGGKWALFDYSGRRITPFNDTIPEFSE